MPVPHSRASQAMPFAIAPCRAPRHRSFTADVLAPCLRAGLAAAMWALCSIACAQTGFSVAALSDYRYRGVSLSNERPTWRAGVTHDGASGWYVGASLAGVSL